MLRTSLLLTALSSLALTACSSSSDGDKQENEALFPICIETRQSIGLDDETPLDITAREAFQQAWNQQVADLRWHDASQTEVRFFAEGELRGVTLVEREPNRGSGERPLIEMAHECDDFLEAEVSAIFATEDGAFDESWEALRLQFFSTQDGPSIRASHALDLEDLGGGYVPNELDASEYDRIVQPTVQLSIKTGGRFEGSFTYMAEKRQDDGPAGSVSAMVVTAATWE